MDDTAAVSPMQVGRVQFAAQADSGRRVFSEAGAPVTVSVPGSVIAKVVDQVGPDPEPVFWRFRASGAALGIAGLDYDVTAVAQTSTNGERTDLADGLAKPGTLLSKSTMTIYPASANGDCSTVPDVGPDQEDRNVRLAGATDVELQAPGANRDGAVRTDEWCAAISWQRDPDGVYANGVQVVATGENGTQNGALDDWSSVVAFPASLDPLGDYLSRVDASATAADGSTSHDDDRWGSRLFPDPKREPDVTLELDPTVTSVKPPASAGPPAHS